MKTAFGLLALILLLPSPPAGGAPALPSAGVPALPSAAFLARCERDVIPRFEVDWQMSGFTIDNKVSSKVLHNRAVHGHAGEFMLGMTGMQARAEIGISIASLHDAASGQECLAPRLTVDLLLPPLGVFVARELPPVSCSYRAVLEHEMQHVRVYQEALPRMAALLRERLAQRYGGKPTLAPGGTGLDRLSADVDTWLRPLIQSEMLRVERLQRAIDSDEENFRLSGVCGGELIANLTGRY